MLIRPFIKLMKFIPYWLTWTVCQANRLQVLKPETIANLPSTELQSENKNKCISHSATNLFANACLIPPSHLSPETTHPDPVSPKVTNADAKIRDAAIVFSTSAVVSTDTLATVIEAYGLQKQAATCEVSEDSPQIGDVVALWNKIVDVGAEWCCTSGFGCDVVAEYRSAEVALCSQRELCVRCFHISFGVGRLMRSCVKNKKAQGSLGTKETLQMNSVPVIRLRASWDIGQKVLQVVDVPDLRANVDNFYSNRDHRLQY